MLMCVKYAFGINYKEILIAKHDQNIMAMYAKDVKSGFSSFYN